MENDYVPLGTRRYFIEQGFDTTVITVPSVKPLILVGFMVIWLVAWTLAGVFFAWPAYLENHEPFLAFWLICWVLGWIGVVYQLLWLFTGKETIRLRGGDMEIGIWVLGIPRRKLYRGHQIHDLQLVLANPRRTAGNDLAANLFDRLSFTYGSRTHRFANGIDLAEAKEIHAFLCARLPNARPKANT